MAEERVIMWQLLVEAKKSIVVLEQTLQLYNLDEFENSFLTRVRFNSTFLIEF